MASSSITEVIECPVCLEVPDVRPIYRCPSNGHIACKNCKRKLGETCPVCRSTAGFIRSLTAERLVEQFTSVAFTPKAWWRPASKDDPRCFNVGRGCRKHLTPEHQLACRYRAVYCPDSSCQKRVILCSLINGHFKSDHPEMPTNPGKGSTILKLIVRDENLGGSYASKPSRFIHGGLSFYREVLRDEVRRVWYFWAYFDGNEMQASSFEVNIQLLDDKKKPIFTFRNRPVPLDFSVEQVMMESRALAFPDDFVTMTLIKNNKINLLISVSGR